MKKILLAIVISNFCFAQVAIEKASVDGSGILYFASGTTKGIILPVVTNSSAMSNITPGTIVYDKTTAKVQYYDGFWKDLTEAGIAPALIAGTDLAINKGVIIGDQNTTAEGVLVLESPSKSLILPKINDPVLNVKSPVAGMVCYDPVKKIMCIYNGQSWSFWK